MKLIQQVLNLEQRDYYKKHLAIINCLLPTYLTEKEIEVLAAFMSLEKNITDEDMFNTVARKKVRAALTLSPGGLGNHLKSMIRKKVIDKNEITNKLTIKGFIFPEEKSQGYQIKIIKNESK